LAARRSVGLDALFRVYLAGYRIFADFVSGVINEFGCQEDLCRLQTLQSFALERLMAELSEEYRREDQRGHRGQKGLRLRQVRDLISGDLRIVPDLGYEMEAVHLGLCASGSSAALHLARLAKALDASALVLPASTETVWAWLGRRNGIDREVLTSSLISTWPASVPLAIGSPGLGLSGWRLSHRQAKAAFSLAQRRRCVVEYADVAHLASMSTDQLLLTSLRNIFLQPVTRGRDGEVLEATLRAYFAGDRNRSSAAAILGVSRQTVANRLQTVETRLGRQLEACAPQLEAMLELEDLGRAVS
jgi:hypothetical protein